MLAAALPFTLAGPPPAYTGSFGEPACNACHFDYPLNEGVAAIEIGGLPAHYQPGRRYELRLVLQRDSLARGGFQLSARFEDGAQAGRVLIADSLVLRVQAGSNGVQYLSHTRTGADRTGAWHFVWLAPASARPVTLSVAVNVPDHDDSPLGDRIFTRQFSVKPMQSGK